MNLFSLKCLEVEGCQARLHQRGHQVSKPFCCFLLSHTTCWLHPAAGTSLHFKMLVLSAGANLSPFKAIGKEWASVTDDAQQKAQIFPIGQA